MVNSNANAIGIIFPNSYDNLVPELAGDRLMASIPFAGRYRIIDFLLSSLANCGISNIAIVVRENYHSLMDHLGSGRAWDLLRKNGGLSIFPPYAEKNMKVYSGRVEALESILPYLKCKKEKYVIMMDANIAVDFDFNAMLAEHIESGADVTVAYTEQEIPAELIRAGVHGDMYYTLKLDDGRVRRIFMNSEMCGKQNLSMNIYIMDREALIDKIHAAFVRGYSYFERDILAPRLEKYNIRGYKYDGYYARICGLKSYFDENMKLLDDENLDALFTGGQIYTKIRDDNPTRYINGCKTKNNLVADGCVIEGDVENCVLFRGVKIAKGAKIRNSVLMQDTVVNAGARLDYVVTDKNVTIEVGQELKGTDTQPFYVAKGHTV
ncbi:glucose-1-phosphate adenylyltransferase subunit GlgD [Clostridium sp. AM34-11AC]|uniref:glucose-1-phosphate adenylyltransferase subunit GlgD n=1 Tax=Clostridium sp. AM34-11AC TaxID=2305242 RepID=UPI0008230B9C|nr:glucose-1-phosphate adenylyltransferase subunit GlgD [Clostridium sp. AM34-11AC]RGE08200.1 glucose-1-phosphate adenylyltransferase subunit GlgD [Clostridium sp. AM34-11AC]SCH18876.1 Glucose-1-phosphate adenylyltransferase [uncultured Clostridium sp.]